MQNRKKALIIGAGPSVRRFKHLETIKKMNWNGLIISTDFMLKHCIAAGIIPDYCMTAEGNLRILDFFVRDGIHENPTTKDELDKHSSKVTMVISRKTHKEVQAVIKSRKFKDVLVCDDKQINESSNIGLFCCIYAQRYLNCLTLVLVGFDHAEAEGWKPIFDPGDDSFILMEHPVFKTKQLVDPNFQVFREEFLEWSHTRPCIIINATEGGSLWGDGIECLKLSQLMK